MSKPDEPYRKFIIETYVPDSLSGKRGKIHCRPVAGQGIDTSIDVECSRSVRDYPVGTKFSVVAKLTDRKDGGEYFYSHHSWAVVPIEE